MSRKVIVGFLYRFIACLVVFSLAYVLIFGLPKTNSQAGTPGVKQLAALRASLDETYIAGNSLAGFNQSDAGAYDTLNNLHDEYQKAVQDLNTNLTKSPPALTQSQRNALSAIISRQKQAISDYKLRFAVLTQIISYDPTADLNLPLEKSASTVAARASAASRGLTNVADNQSTAAISGSLGVQNENGPEPLVNSSVRTALISEAGCFARLASQITSHLLTAAGQTRQACVQAYPGLRLAAIQNVTRGAFTPDYQSSMGQVPGLLKQLDRQISRSNH